MQAWPEGVRVADSRFVMRCGHQQLNDRNPHLDQSLRVESTEEDQELQEQGILYEDSVRASLVSIYDIEDLSLRDNIQDRIDATQEAMERGDAIIIGGTLPEINNRRGAPDVLILDTSDSRSENRNSYYPCDVKNRFALSDPKSSEQQLSRLQDLRFENSTIESVSRTKLNEDDSLQLAHYWRMLQDLDRAPTNSPVGAIIDKTGIAFWRDLNDALAAYDQKFDLRATAVLALINDNEELIPPIWNDKWCAKCHWRDVCDDRLVSEQHVSVLKGVTYIRSKELQENNISTWSDLVSADLKTQPKIGKWARAAKDTALIRLSGETRPFLPREPDPNIFVPRADIEIDFDLEEVSVSEWLKRDALVYLWGTVTTFQDSVSENLRHQIGSDFQDFSVFTDSQIDKEGSAFLRFWKWTCSAINLAKENNLSIKFYCCNGKSTEISRMKRIAASRVGVVGMPSGTEIDEFASSDFYVDILDHVKRLLLPTDDNGLKSVAHLAGFTWDDPSANGEKSVFWFQQWGSNSSNVALQEELMNKILTYNRNDCEATRAVRNWINHGMTSSTDGFKSISTLDS